MAYFRVGNTASGGGTGTGATITVTYSSDFYGETLTATNGNKTVTVVAPSTGTVDIEVPEGGTWTISATIGGYTYSTSVVVNLAYSTTITTFNATVTVTFPYALGATCTLSDGVTTLTATQSPMAFSVGRSGTWTATVTLEGISKTDSAVITTDGQSEALTIEYGTINLTYDNEFRGLTVTCTDGNTTISKTAPSGSNAMVFYPPNTGTWTIGSNYSGTAYSTNATISSLSTAVSANLETIPNGSSVTPTDDIQIWLECAQISGLAYTTLAEVLADTDTLWDLLANSNACDYMARSTTWANDTVADSTAMTYIGKIDYCAEALLSDSTWASAIGNSTYFESVLNVKVPTMTSDTTPSGTCICSSTDGSTWAAWKAFDNSTSTYWSGTTTTDEWVGYIFPSVVKVTKAIFTVPIDNSNKRRVKNYKIEKSTDSGSTWETLCTGLVADGTTETIVDESFTNSGSADRYRLYITDCYGTYHIWVKELQFYGRTSSYTENYTKIHSAASDSIYYVDNGNNVTLGTTDTNGDLSILTANLPSGNITLYSSVAKNPTDLSADYSKVVRMNENVTEVYVMPYGALYWWGHKYNLEEISSANGWSMAFTYKAPTYNTNNIAVSISNQQSGVSSKNAVTATDAHWICQTSNKDAEDLMLLSAKDRTSTRYIRVSQTSNNTIEHCTGTTTSATGYATYEVVGGGSATGTLYAMWYE